MNKEEKKLLKVYNEYIISEFESEPIDTLDGCEEIGLMFTEVEDGDYSVQVSYDIDSEELIVKIWCDKDHIYEHREECKTSDFIEELSCASFDGYYSYAHEVCDNHFKLDLEW